MSDKSLRSTALCLAVLLPVFGSAAATSAGLTQRGGSVAPNPLTVTLIKNGLYMISGEENSLVRLSANGNIVVNGQVPGHYDFLKRRIRRISELPIRLLITTDHHQEHTASNSLFLAEGAQILAHGNVKRRLEAASDSGTRDGLPTRTYDGREFSLTLGGIHVQLKHYGNAHTDGDTVVYFPDLKVVAVGDLFGQPPDPDFSAGGSMTAWGNVLGEILKLDFDTVIPARGPKATRADLVAYKARIDTLVSSARALVTKGVPKAQLFSQLGAADSGWRYDWTPERIERFYGELTQAP